MKRILFLIASFWAVYTITYAQTSDNLYQNITLTVSNTQDTGREIPEQQDVQPGGGPRARGVILQPAYAYLYNNVISVNFPETFSIVTIRITNEVTGETVYSETSSNPAGLNIDLNGENCGDYLIEIEAGGAYLEGNFSLRL